MITFSERFDNLNISELGDLHEEKAREMLETAYKSFGGQGHRPITYLNRRTQRPLSGSAWPARVDLTVGPTSHAQLVAGLVLLAGENQRQ